MHFYTPPFSLRSGRRIWIERFYVQQTAWGVACGSPERIREHIIRELPSLARRLFGQPAFLTPPPKGDPLPRFLAIADCMSAEGKEHAKATGNSSLVVAWFADRMPTDIQAEVTAILNDVNWELNSAEADGI